MIGKHVVIDTLDNFKAKLDLIPSSAIVLIKDVGQIYAHGTYFGAQKTYSLLTKTADGLAPKGGTSASSLISNVNTEWVLTVTNGENPTWRKLPANAFSSSSYTLSSATTSDLGGIKVGQVCTATFDDLVGLYYKINIDKNGLAYVHVPWINNPYTASGNGITLKDNVFSLSLNSATKLDSAIGNKIYAVSLDKNGKLCVSVPWTDTNNIFVGATETKNGSSGMVPAPIANQHSYFLRGDGTWVKPNLSDLNDDVINGKYLPLTGGTISSASWLPLTVDSTHSGGGVAIKISTSGVKRGGITYNTKGLQLYNENCQKFISVTDDGVPMFSDNTLIHSGNYSDYALPLSGGTMGGDITLTKNSGKTTTYAIDFYDGTHKYLFAEGGVLKYGANPNINTIIHSGNIESYNAGSATKLQTARTIWGQSFDGTGNVSGSMTEVSNITMSGDIIMNNNMGVAIKNTNGAHKWVLLVSTDNRTLIGSTELDSYIRGNNINITYGSSQTSGIYLNSSGNVGIGTTSPNAKLHVDGHTLINKRLTIGLDLGNWDPTRAEIELISPSNSATDFWLGSGKRDWAISSRDSSNNYNLVFYACFDDETCTPRLTLEKTGTFTVAGPLHIGSNNTRNYIAFYGTTGDNPGSFNHTYIGENLWASSESSELVLFKGNDVATTVTTAASSGPDRIRHIAAGHLFQIYKSALSGTFESICTSTVPVNILSLNLESIVSYVTLRPDTNDKLSLGTSSYKWKNVYATTFTGALSGNASTASKLATARTISLTGSVTGSVSFDGSGNVSIATTTNHTHAYVARSGSGFNQYNTGTYVKILEFTISSGSLSPSISFSWHPTECAREIWADFNINIRANDISFKANWKGGNSRTLTCVGNGTTFSVWVTGSKSYWDPYGVVQVTHTYAINSYSAGTLQITDTVPSGTYSKACATSGYSANAGNSDTVDGYHLSVTSSAGTDSSIIYFVT